MIKRALVLVVSLALLAPVQTSAQGFGLGASAGTLGLKGDLALSFSDRVVVRGGIGFMPIDPDFTFGDLDMSLSLPTVYTVGLDVYLNGAFRVGAGILFRADDPEATGSFSSDQDIGGTRYTPQEIGRLTGVLDGNGAAPYVLIGFGRHTAMGVGLFIDIGAAFVGDPTVRLSADGTLSGDAGFASSLQQEADQWEEEMRGYLKIYPIINLGLRMGGN